MAPTVMRGGQSRRPLLNGTGQALLRPCEFPWLDRRRPVQSRRPTAGVVPPAVRGESEKKKASQKRVGVCAG